MTRESDLSGDMTSEALKLTPIRAASSREKMTPWSCRDHSD
jgi:hypothetical protein